VLNFVLYLVVSARVFEVFLIVLDGVQGGTLWGGESRARNSTHKRKRKAKRGRLGVWLYSPHTRVARGEEREPASSEPAKPELKP